MSRQPKKCPVCKGTGFEPVAVPAGHIVNVNQKQCTACGGAGTEDGSYGIYDKYGRPKGCELCEGSGKRLNHEGDDIASRDPIFTEVPCDHFLPSHGARLCLVCSGKGWFRTRIRTRLHGHWKVVKIRCGCVHVDPLLTKPITTPHQSPRKVPVPELERLLVEELAAELAEQQVEPVKEDTRVPSKRRVARRFEDE